MNTGWPSLSAPSATGNGQPAPPESEGNVGRSTKGPPPARPHARIRLASVSDVAAQLRVIYREARAGTIATNEATKLAYLLNMLAGIITASDLEARLQALEADKAR
jgi:hypothetical protein